MLREIEQSLLAEDPKFGTSVAQESGFGGQPNTGRLTMRSVALMVLGLVLLIGGVALASMSMWAIILSIIGFGVMFAGGIMALRAPAGGSVSPQAARANQKPRSQRTVTMEENFKRRFEGR